ncbi:MAG: hypothetical protein FD138_286 [Planctomycetota bacterium]|nr:MAG: hypothetical protein FD138_286 [Planctomycetota bacterium]
MSQDTKTRPQKPPEKKIGPFASGIGVAIWLNESEAEDGTVRHFRSASYQPSDLPALLFCLAKAQEYCYETPVPGQQESEAAESEGGGGDRF